MKKIFICIIIFSLILTVLVSCSPKENNNEKDGESENMEQNIEPDTTYDASSEVIEIISFDGYSFKGRLTIPSGGNISKLVIYVNGSGANTYDNRRTGFNYFDTFANEFSNRGIAFFSYNTRGVDIGDNPPMYNTINEEEYKTYLPLNSVEDVYYMIKTIKENDRLKDCKVYLLGWSEGTIIAPLIAEKYPDMVDGLFLAGYANKNMKDILIWQTTGGSSYAWFAGNFVADEQGKISRDAFNADPNNVMESVLQNAPFEEFDKNNDGYIDEEDCITRVTAILGNNLNDILSAIERRDDIWIKNNYGGGLIPLTSGWFLEYFNLRSNQEVLPGLDLPIYIFHGTLDMNVDVREVYRINERFQELGKTNLTINVFEQHNHDLNFADIIQNKGMSAGFQAIFDAISDIK